MNRFFAVERVRPLKLHAPLALDHQRTGNYHPAQGLPEAADVAMLLGVPLLLTGRPGTGKTRAAYWLAEKLEAGRLLRHDVKSGSSGRDLLYTFDEVARFRDASRGEAPPLISYLRFSALGEAILRAAGGEALLTDLTGTALEGAGAQARYKLIERAFGPGATNGRVTVAHLLPDDPGFAQAQPEHRVVLIDELDKAPRDTPNDLLAEVENMAFDIPELGVSVAAHPSFRPIVILTSNSDKLLPEPFLRRCAYFDIPPPDTATLVMIVASAIGGLTGKPALIAEAVHLFQLLNDAPEIRKKPGTAELLAWLDALDRRHKLDDVASLRAALARDDTLLDHSIGVLLKSREDIEAGKRLLRDGIATYTPRADRA